MPARTAGSAPARLPTLTGLRAVAALLVFARHVSGFLPATAAAGYAHVAGVGVVGVSFFFVLSGFVLAWTHRSGDTARAFYRRRCARILPNHVVTWIAAAVALGWVGYRSGAFARVAAFLLVQPWVPREAVYYGGNGVEWSLGCEVFFYLTFPLLVPVLSSRVRLRRALIVVSVLTVFALAAVLRPPPTQLLGFHDQGLAAWAVYNFPPARLPEFVLGAALALECRDGWVPRLSVRAAALLAAAAVVAAAASWSSFSPVAITLLPFAALIVAAAGADVHVPRPSLGAPVWQRLGEWSFAFYLVHQVVIRVVAARTTLASPGAVAAAAAGALVASWALSAVLFTVVERPAERWLRRPARRRVDLAESVAATEAAR